MLSKIQGKSDKNLRKNMGSSESCVQWVALQPHNKTSSREQLLGGERSLNLGSVNRTAQRAVCWRTNKEITEAGPGGGRCYRCSMFTSLSPARRRLHSTIAGAETRERNGDCWEIKRESGTRFESEPPRKRCPIFVRTQNWHKTEGRRTGDTHPLSPPRRRSLSWRDHDVM